MKPPEFIPREEIAAQLQKPLNLLNPAARDDITQGSLVLAMGTGHYISEPLTSSTSEDVDNTPFGWRVMVPAVGDAVLSLTSVSFGVEPDAVPNRYVEMMIDREIIEQRKSHPEVDVLFRAVGDDIVRRVRDSGDSLFSAIERRRKPEGLSEVHSSQLIYSPALLQTQRLVERYRELHRKQKEPVPEWVYPAILPENRRKVARFMAISGLATSLINEP